MYDASSASSVPWSGTIEHEDDYTRKDTSMTRIDHSLRPAFAITIVMLLGGLAGGCGGGADETDRPTTEATEESAESGVAATFTVGEESWDFERVLCAFGPEKTEVETTTFTMLASKDGISVNASIDERFGHVMSLQQTGRDDGPLVLWEAGGPGPQARAEAGDLIQLDGERVTASGTFVDPETGESAEGTFTGECTYVR